MSDADDLRARLVEWIEEARTAGVLGDMAPVLRGALGDALASTGKQDSGDIPMRFGMVGESPAMQIVFKLLERVAPSNVPVLIHGETGSGKELVARALHDFGSRPKGPFLAENCAAVPPTLLESELFGHKKGAFTDAHADRPGHFVTASGGTLFLDEIGDMPLEIQSQAAALP